MIIKEKYISLLTDYGFKLIFGTESNKEFLPHFLNQILPPRFQINGLSFIPNENLGDKEQDRRAVFDVYCEGLDKERYVLEMQNSSQPFFKDRSLFYTSFSIREQGKKGDWDFELAPVFTISILNFRFSDKKIRKKKRILHNVYLRDEDGDIFYEKLGHYYVELPNFEKSIDQVVTNFDKWLFLFTELPKLKEIPEGFEDPIFQKLFRITATAALSPAEQKKYIKSMKSINDYNNSLKHQHTKGYKKGLAELAQYKYNAEKERSEIMQQKMDAERRVEMAMRKAEIERIEKLKAKRKAEIERQEKIEAKRKVEIERQEKIEAKKKVQMAAKRLEVKGMSLENIADLLDLSIEEVRELLS